MQVGIHEPVLLPVRGMHGRQPGPEDALRKPQQRVPCGVHERVRGARK